MLINYKKHFEGPQQLSTRGVFLETLLGKVYFGELHCKYPAKPRGGEGERNPNLHCFPCKLPECVEVVWGFNNLQ